MEAEGGIHCSSSDLEDMEDAFNASRRKAFSNDKYDRGGATMCGVTLTTYRRHNPHADVDALKRISFAEWKEIVYSEYWKAMRCGHIWPSVAIALADFGFNSGPARGVRYLQVALNNVVPRCSLRVDGKIGHFTCREIAALSARQQAAVVADYCERRRVFIRRSVNVGGINGKYLAGLLSRTSRLERLCKKFID